MTDSLSFNKGQETRTSNKEINIDDNSRKWTSWGLHDFTRLTTYFYKPFFNEKIQYSSSNYEEKTLL